MRGCSSTAAATSFKLLPASAATGREGGRGGVLSSLGSGPPQIQIGSLRFQGLGSAGGGSASACSRGNLCRLVLLRRIPICPVACSSSPSSKSQVELEPTVEDHPQLLDQDDSRMVRVKMQLQKECQFGEHFLFVGAHPALGLWNPLDAVPMIWSEGHVWTAELDIPLGEPVQFKFILRKINGEFLWQPGQDRVLHTWETSNIISVFEDWDNVEAQQVTEERVDNNNYEESDELMTDEIEQLNQSHEKCSEEQEPEVETHEASDSAHSVAESSGQTVATVEDNITHHSYPDMNRVGSSSTATGGEISDSQDGSSESEKPPFPTVADSITSQMERTVEISGNEVVAENVISHTINDVVAISDKGLMISENSLEIKEAPVLVPGLNPCSTTSNEDEAAEEKQVEVELDISNNSSNAELEEPVQGKGLVPGLNPCSTTSNEDVTAEEEQVEVELDISDKGSKTELGEPVLDQDQVEVKEHLEKEEAKDSLMFNDEHDPIEHPNELVFNDNEEANDKPDQDLESALFERQSDTESQNDLESSLWYNDINWGKKTLKKILNNLGFF